MFKVMVFVLTLLLGFDQAKGEGILCSLEFQRMENGACVYKALYSAPDLKSTPLEATERLVRSLLRLEGHDSKADSKTEYLLTSPTGDMTGYACELRVFGVEGIDKRPKLSSVKFRSYGWNSISYLLVQDNEFDVTDLDQACRAVADLAATEGGLDAPVQMNMARVHPDPKSMLVTVYFGAVPPQPRPMIPQLEQIPPPEEEGKKEDRTT